VPAPRKHSQEMRERAQRMVREARAREPGLSVNGACKRIGPQLRILPDTLRGWCKQTSIDRGETPGTTTEDAKRIRELEPRVGPAASRRSSPAPTLQINTQ